MFVLVAGWHRLEAAKRLGWKQITAKVSASIQLDAAAELAEIDENLIRADLTPAERALHIGRRKELYEQAHPETKTGKSPGKAGGGKKEAMKPNLGSFASATAKATGQSKTKVKRDATRAKKVAVLGEIAGTSLDKGAGIDALAKLPEAEQRKLAAAAKAGKKVTAKSEAPKAKAKSGRTCRSISATTTSIRSLRLSWRTSVTMRAPANSRTRCWHC